MSKEDQLNLVLTVQLTREGKVLAHEEVIAHGTLLTLKEGGMLMEDAFSKIVSKAIPKARDKFSKQQEEDANRN
jgi:hypothetical protein